MKNKKLHICLHLISDPNWHAGNIYIFNLINAISKIDKQERDEIKLSLATRHIKDVPADIQKLLNQVYIDSIFVLGFYKILSILPAFLRFKCFNFRKIDFYYPPGNFPKKWIFNWGGWIPDFQYKHLPHLFSKEEYNSREIRNKNLAEQSPILAFSSQNALNDYQNFFPENANNAYLLRFVSNANPNWLADDTVAVQQKFNLPNNFFIVCNQFWKHKDHQTVIKAMSFLKQKGIEITVVCTGATEDFRNPDYYPSLIKLAEELGVVNQLKVLGFISRNDQIQLIRRSMAIIQPSQFEGWSTVVEDGRSLGKHIFLSDFDVHLEQNPPNTWFFEMGNAEDLAAKIEGNLSQIKAGPNKENEEKAFLENQNLMKEYGLNFVKMARKNLS
ncbi:MAG: glycosyltransferase [Bacteroidia bacterium]|nr:glycosyltransferase [Bacteroidia bacterium]